MIPCVLQAYTVLVCDTKQRADILECVCEFKALWCSVSEATYFGAYMASISSLSYIARKSAWAYLNDVTQGQLYRCRLICCAKQTATRHVEEEAHCASAVSPSMPGSFLRQDWLFVQTWLRSSLRWRGWVKKQCGTWCSSCKQGCRHVRSSWSGRDSSWPTCKKCRSSSRSAYSACCFCTLHVVSVTDTHCMQEVQEQLQVCYTACCLCTLHTDLCICTLYSGGMSVSAVRHKESSIQNKM